MSHCRLVHLFFYLTLYVCFTTMSRKVSAGAVLEQARPSTTAVHTRQQPAPTQAQFMQWGFARPSGTGAGTATATAGVLPSGINKCDPRLQTQGAVSGQGQGQGADYSAELGQNRRPHTANIVRSADGQGGSGNGEVSE